MQKGALIGAAIGFLAGVIIQSTGTPTGMLTISTESTQFIATTISILFFIAALFGVIGAFLGALIQEVLEKKKFF